MDNKTMPTAEEIGTATARAALYAHDVEAERISANFEKCYADRMPARGAATGATRLLKAQELAPMDARLKGSLQLAEAEKAKVAAKIEEQKARNVRRGEEAEHHRLFMATVNGKPYETLHDDTGLSSLQKQSWKSTPEEIARVRSGRVSPTRICAEADAKAKANTTSDIGLL